MRPPLDLILLAEHPRLYRLEAAGTQQPFAQVRVAGPTAREISLLTLLELPFLRIYKEGGLDRASHPYGIWDGEGEKLGEIRLSTTFESTGARLLGRDGEELARQAPPARTDLPRRMLSSLPFFRYFPLAYEGQLLSEQGEVLAQVKRARGIVPRFEVSLQDIPQPLLPLAWSVLYVAWHGL